MLAPDSQDIVANLAYGLVISSQYDLAVNLYAFLVLTEPDEFNWRCGFVYCLLRMEREAEARTHFTELHRLVSNDTEAEILARLELRANYLRNREVETQSPVAGLKDDADTPSPPASG